MHLGTIEGVKIEDKPQEVPMHESHRLALLVADGKQYVGLCDNRAFVDVPCENVYELLTMRRVDERGTLHQQWRLIPIMFSNNGVVLARLTPSFVVFASEMGSGEARFREFIGSSVKEIRENTVDGPPVVVTPEKPRIVVP